MVRAYSRTTAGSPPISPRGNRAPSCMIALLYGQFGLTYIRLGRNVSRCKGPEPMTIVDQQKIRRTRTGLIAHDPALAQPGYTLFAPMFGDGRVCLIGMDGAVAHEWRMPYRPGLYGYLLDNGHLFYS